MSLGGLLLNLGRRGRHVAGDAGGGEGDGVDAHSGDHSGHAEACGGTRSGCDYIGKKVGKKVEVVFRIILSEYRGDAEHRKPGVRGRGGVLTCASESCLHRTHARHRVHEVWDHRRRDGRLLTLHNHLAQQVYRRDAGKPRSVSPVRLRLGRLRGLRGRRLRRANLSYVAEELLELSLRRRSPQPPQVTHHVLHTRGSFHRHGELLHNWPTPVDRDFTGYALSPRFRASCASRLVTTAPNAMRRLWRRPRKCLTRGGRRSKRTEPPANLYPVTFTRPSGPSSNR